MIVAIEHLKLDQPQYRKISPFFKEMYVKTLQDENPFINHEDIKENIPIESSIQESSIQKTIIDILIKKIIKATKETGIKNVCIAGGVSANSGLRNALADAGKQYHWQIFIPAFEYCTDNGAMIAIVAYYKYLAEEFASLDIGPSARTVA